MIKRFLFAKVHFCSLAGPDCRSCGCWGAAGERSDQPPVRLLLISSSRVDGSGDFATLQAAIETIPASNTRRITIFVRDGVYEEKVLLRQNRSRFGREPRRGTAAIQRPAERIRPSLRPDWPRSTQRVRIRHCDSQSDHRKHPADRRARLCHLWSATTIHSR